MSDRTSLVAQQEIVLHAAVTGAALAVGPATAVDVVYGESTAAFVPAPTSDLLHQIAIKGDAGITIANPRLVGQVADKAGALQWYDLGDLNGGQAIVITAAVGWSRELGAIGVFTRLGIISSSITGGNATFSVTPQERDV